MSKKKQYVRPGNETASSSGSLSTEPLEKMRMIVENLVGVSSGGGVIGDVPTNVRPEDAKTVSIDVVLGALEILRERHKAFKAGLMTERQQVLSREKFVAEMVARGFLPKDKSFETNERIFRLAIAQIRTKDGEWVLSTGGKYGGYWIVDDPARAQAYLETEVIPRIEEMVKIVIAYSRPRVPQEWRQSTLELEIGAV